MSDQEEDDGQAWVEELAAAHARIAELESVVELLNSRPTHPPTGAVDFPRMVTEAQAQLAAVTRDRDEAKAQIANWHNEVARFNRGWERRAEPYSALEDEFEQMGYAWANFDKARADLAAARAALEPFRRLEEWLRGTHRAIEARHDIDDVELRLHQAEGDVEVEGASFAEALSAALSKTNEAKA